MKAKPSSSVSCHPPALSQDEPDDQSRKVFDLDLVGQANSVDSDLHFRDKGLNSLFTDGSVVFVKNAKVWTIVAMGGSVNALQPENMCNLVDGGP